ncbi:MAG: AAA family ATPase, partial [Verrucomicrobia bacterium]|nr:AAA family ATPase [Verrucomicrobiota bacterium]
LLGTLPSVLALLHTPPSTIMEVQGYLYFYIHFYEGYKKGRQYLLEYFGSMQKVYTVAALTLVTLLALNYMKNWLRLGLCDHISIFENLNLKVKGGLIGPSVGRIDERKKLDNCWAKSIDQKYRIAMIVGPTGCGKTQMIEGIAWEAENDPASPYYGKKVYQINTADLLNHKPYVLDSLLLDIKGHEDDAILFFDEAHSAAVSQVKVGSLLQLFKTKLPQNVRIGLATTRLEFDQYIKPDVAFTDRVEEIPMESLSDDNTRAVVKNAVRQDEEQALEVHESAYDALLKVAATDPAYAKRVNPRKSLQLIQKLSSSVFQWTPSLLAQTLNQALREEKTTLDEIREASRQNENWSNSPTGKQVVSHLLAQRQSIQKLREQIIAQQQQLEKIRHLQKLQMIYRKRMNEVIHLLAANPQHQEKAEKNFLLLKFMLLPQVQQALREEANSFEKEYKEKVPLVLDAEWIMSQFPACFQATKPT